MKLQYIGFIIWFTFFAFHSASCASDELGQNEQNAILSRADAAFGRLVHFYTQNGFEFQPPKEPARAVWESQDEVNQRPEFTADWTAGPEIKLLPENLEIFQYYDPRLEHNATLGGKRKLVERPQPSWSREKVLSIATQFANAVLGSFPQELGSPDIQWKTDPSLDRTTGVTTYSHGEWNVWWPREVDKYRFGFQEGVSVQIYEDFGPYSFSATIVTRFEHIGFVPIAEKDALPEAVKGADAIMKWAPLVDTLRNGAFDKSPGMATLKIIRPNHLTSSNDIPTSPTVNGRLAWEFWFGWYLNGKQHDIKHPDNILIVWIDAQNKEFLGGDVGKY